MKKTLYDIFEVSPDANPEAIRNAYKSLVQRHHPDKNQGDPHAEEVLKAINFAYGVLSDPMKRLAYDASLASMRGVQNPVTPPDDSRSKSADKKADVRRQGANGGGVSDSEAAAPEVDQAARAQPKNRWAAILLLALLLAGGVLVLLLPDGDGQDEVSSLALTKSERKLDVASGDQAVPTRRPMTEMSPAQDRRAPEIKHNDSVEHVGAQVRQQDADMVAPAPIGKQNNVAVPSAKIQPIHSPLLNERASVETSNAKPKDTAHPAQQLAGQQAKVNEGGHEAASEQGSAVAIGTQGDAKQQGTPPQSSLQTGELPGKAVAQRDPMASHSKKGVAYEKGQGVPQDPSQAAQWYRKAAEQGIPDAQYHLGKLYTVGKGVPIDNVEAYAWLSLAAAGNVEAAKPVVDYLASTMTPEQLASAQRRATAFRKQYKR
ncbi:MAG: DnaJ domain-containing protein [Gammaproteobacteria bacterium]|nr:DnaJ domain-containing protein [Gammaproteobacteria bacterium]